MNVDNMQAESASHSAIRSRAEDLRAQHLWSVSIRSAC